MPSAGIGFGPRNWQCASLVWSQWTWWMRFGKHGAKANRLFFMKYLIGQQTWNEYRLYVSGSQRGQYSSETLRVNGGDIVTIRARQPVRIGWSLAESVSVSVSVSKSVSVSLTNVNHSNWDSKKPAISHYLDQDLWGKGQGHIKVMCL